MHHLFCYQKLRAKTVVVIIILISVGFFKELKKHLIKSINEIK